MKPRHCQERRDEFIFSLDAEKSAVAIRPFTEEALKPQLVIARNVATKRSMPRVECVQS